MKKIAKNSIDKRIVEIEHENYNLMKETGITAEFVVLLEQARSFVPDGSKGLISRLDDMVTNIQVLAMKTAYRAGLTDGMQNGGAISGGYANE
jgi:hypothetical protein